MTTFSIVGKKLSNEETGGAVRKAEQLLICRLVEATSVESVELARILSFFFGGGEDFKLVKEEKMSQRKTVSSASGITISNI